MSINRLHKRMSVPKKPYKAAMPANWESIEESLGTKLPSDYKAFINTYGSGLICGFLEIYNPFAAKAGEEVEWFRATIGMFEVFTINAPLFPKEGGLLPCGLTDNSGLYIHVENYK